MSEHIFALDIGTRSVVGLVGEKRGDLNSIKAVEAIEHRNRAMIDGQIHNIEQVAKVVKTVKSRLEKKTNMKLKKAAVAAAGRALITISASNKVNLSQITPITNAQILDLEIEAVQKAQQEIHHSYKSNNSSDTYHCVGYSVKKYYLEDTEIGSLLDQQGNSMGVEVVVTFLPRLVVDSLFTVLKKCNLEMHSLTLEPIAASELVIPDNMRQLNIALVDIGAGTSDIAITQKGAINAYAMVPVAGDEITEALCSELLLDFDNGEMLKRNLYKQQVYYNDVLGQRIEANSREIIAKIESTIEDLADKIAKEILNINGKSPQAVFCIGGGSMLPILPSVLANKLGLPLERVVVKGKDIINNIKSIPNKFNGPELMTPIGIFLSSNKRSGLINVEVNGKLAGFFSNGEATVLDALIGAGISPMKIHGKPGRSLTVTVNGKLTILKGTVGTPGKIFVNGKEANTKTTIDEYSKIDIVEGRNGIDRQAQVIDLLDKNQWPTIILNGEKVSLKPEITINGDKINNFMLTLEDNSIVKIIFLENLGNLLQYKGYRLQQFPMDSCTLHLNGTKRDINILSEVVKVNEQHCPLNTILVNGDHVILERKKLVNTVSELLEFVGASVWNDFYIIVNGKEVPLPYKSKIYKNGKESNTNEVIEIGDKISIVGKNTNMIMADVLSHLNYANPPMGAQTKLNMKVNGEPAQFTTRLQQGDKIELNWQ
ncbi:cell division protein FtsA [Desulfitispora alkaliphila]|uniref:cell division FtsA domain-containing protein n=1 Tax=Desulfitispora alkaliphila TaxID=622674 RepID=UPI003D1CA0DD